MMHHLIPLILTLPSIFGFPLKDDGSLCSNIPQTIFFNSCNIDITVMIDFSSSTIQFEKDADQLKNSTITNFLNKFNYSQTNIALMTFGNPSINFWNYSTSFLDICNLTQLSGIQHGSYDFNISTAFKAYFENLPNYKRQKPIFLIVFTAANDKAQIQAAIPIAKNIRNEGVKIIIVALNQTSTSLNSLTETVFLSPNYEISSSISEQMIGLSCSPSPAPLGTPCSQNSAAAWLDVVLVMDVSNAMTSVSLSEAAGQLSTIFRAFPIGQQPRHSTRVGIVTFGTKSTVRQQLSETTDFDALSNAFFQLVNYHDTLDRGGNMLAALQDAGAMFPEKGYRPKVIIIYSAIYDNTGYNDPEETATILKDNGITIITLSFISSEGIPPAHLSELSSPGYAFFNDEDGLNLRMSAAMAEVNCYCPGDTHQFVHRNPQTVLYQKYADCFHGANSPSFPSLADTVCKTVNSFLAPIQNMAKLDFITDIVVPNDIPKAKEFIVGGHYSSALKIWAWWGYNETEIPIDAFPEFEVTPEPGQTYSYMFNYYGFNWDFRPMDDEVAKAYVCQSRAYDADNVIPG